MLRDMNRAMLFLAGAVMFEVLWVTAVQRKPLTKGMP